MMIRSLTMLAGILLGMASAAPKVTCAPYNDPQQYYQGPDDQFLSADAFVTSNYQPPSEGIPYLKRLVKAIQRRGTRLVLINPPRPGFAYVNRLDPETIKNTPFVRAYDPTILNELRASYMNNLQNFQSYGLETVDLFEAMTDYQQKNPNSLIFFKRDTHWSPEGARAAAIGTARYLQTKHAEILEELPKSVFEVTVERVIQRSGSSSWDNTIKRACPDHQLVLEPFPILRLTTKESAAESLLGDDSDQIILAGTSFTSPEPQIGFAYYLSQELGHEVTNYGISGGGPLGSLFDLYGSGNLSSDPKILLWEFTSSQVKSKSINNALMPIWFRQYLPVIEPASVPVYKTQFEVGQAEPNFDFKNQNFSGEQYFLKISFQDYKTRQFNVVLNYEKSNEALTLSHPTSQILSTYYLELLNNGQKLQSMKMELPKEAKGKVLLEVFKYQ